MRWQNREGSQNVEDRRGSGGGGGGMSMPAKGGMGAIMFIAVMVAGYYGIDLSPLVGDTAGLSSGAVVSTPYTPTAEDQEMTRFVSVALKTTEDVWGNFFRQMGRTYPPPKLVLYNGGTDTGCGFGEAAMGPFYCPEDQNVYLDVAFFHDMQRKLGGGGDFAYGYVLAHEVGHHVQHLLGIDQEVNRLQARGSKAQANHMSVRLELQADCYAGVWGNAMQKQGILDAGDLDEAISTAQAIGDDRLQKQSMGRVVPDSFTHGTSAQRQFWFKRGFASGNPNDCDTFSDPR